MTTPNKAETEMIAVKQTGVFLGMKAATQALLSSGNSSIVNTGLLYGLIGSPAAIPHRASKAAVRIMGKANTLEFARQGIRGNTVFLGQIKTPILGDITTEQSEVVKTTIPTGSVGAPMDAAYATLYLASDEAKHVSGSELWVDGAWYAGQ